MRNQRIDERSVGISRGGMHDQSRGFVDDDEILVLVYDCKRNGLRLRFCRKRGRDADVVHLMWFDPGIRVPYFFAAPRDLSGFDQLFQPRPAQVGKPRGKKLVEAGAGIFA